MSDERELIAEREKKAEEIRALGANPYANGFSPTHTAAEIAAKFAGATPPPSSGEKGAPPALLSDEHFAVAGRIVAYRGFGKAAFAKLLDRTGEIQVWVRKDLIGDAAFELWKRMERGDFIGVVGSPTVTQPKSGAGELTIVAENVVVLTKATRPQPEKWHGLSDTEIRYRQRYVDLVANPEVREVFRKRSAIVAGIRRFLDARGFLEVETPMMHAILGGAAARPFSTHHNALDLDLYMRIAPELYLKRLVVGSFERVYEIGRNFRNEGLSRQHNPEFTMLEFYQAYATYEDLMKLTETLFQELAREISGGVELTYQGQKLSFASPWPRIPMKDAIVEASQRGLLPGGLERAALDDEAALSRFIDASGLGARGDELGAVLRKSDNHGERVGALFDYAGEKALPADRPAFVTEYPAETSPLSRRNDADPSKVDRFELFIVGREHANAFSELNDPADQRARFARQVEAKAAGREETMDYDDDYCRALEYGLPPTAGEGIGIDRLAMLLTDQPSIRDVILFPLMRKVEMGTLRGSPKPSRDGLRRAELAYAHAIGHMTRQGFEWFVAWRHLRDPDRKTHRTLLAGIGLAALGGLGLAASAIAPRFMHLHAIAPGEWLEARPAVWLEHLRTAGIAAIIVGGLLSLLGALFASFTVFAAVSIYGVFLGTGAPILALSVMSGFENDLKTKIRSTKADVVVETSDGRPFTDFEALDAKLQGIPGLVGSMPYVEAEVIIKHVTNPAGMGIVLRGIDPTRAPRVLGIERTLKEGKVAWLAHPDQIPTEDAEMLRALPGGDLMPEKQDGARPPPKLGAPAGGEARPAVPGILLGEELYEHTLRVFIGSDVDVACPLCGVGPAGPMPKLKTFRVAGHFYSGMYEFDSKLAYVSLADAQRFLGMPGEVTGIEVRTDTPETAHAVADEIGRRLGPGYEVRTWEELNRGLFAALKLEKLAMFVVLTFIALVASFSIISNLIMLVTEKGREVAILKSMGARDVAILRVFFAEGLYIGLVGLALGMGIGIGGCLLLAHYGLPLNPDVYYIEKLPIVMRGGEIAAVSLAALLLCCLATLYPALMASRLRPAEGLRYE